MFLDDELLQIGRSVELTDEGMRKSISSMIKVCFESLHKQLNGKRDELSIKANFKRVNNTWIKVCTKLDKEGLGFAKINGFQLFVEQKPEFKGIFFN